MDKPCTISMDLMKWLFFGFLCTHPDWFGCILCGSLVRCLLAGRYLKLQRFNPFIQIHKKRGNPFFGEMKALFAIVRERSPSVNNLIGTKTLQFAGKVSVNSNERRGSRLFELSVTPENHLLQVMREMENKTSVSDITEWLEEAVEIEKVENNKLAVL